MRFEWKPWGDGSSPEGFGNICDNKNEVIIAKDVLEEHGKLFCNFINGIVGAELSDNILGGTVTNEVLIIKSSYHIGAGKFDELIKKVKDV